MQWSDLFAALALVLILEGIFPFLNPERYRRMIETLGMISDNQLRAIGLVVMALGAILLTVVRGLLA